MGQDAAMASMQLGAGRGPKPAPGFIKVKEEPQEDGDEDTAIITLFKMAKKKRVRCKEEPVDEERREASGTQETYLHAHKRIKLEAEAKVDGGLQHQGESHVGDPKIGNSSNYPSEEGEVDEVKEEVKDEVKDEVKEEVKEEVKKEV